MKETGPSESRVTSRCDRKTKARLSQLVRQLNRQYPGLKFDESAIVRRGLELAFKEAASGKFKPA